MTTTKPIFFYYPTPVVIVDDNKLFLENLPENLDPNSKYELYESPKKALSLLKKQKKSLLTLEDFIGKTDDFTSEESLNIDLIKIKSLSEKKNHLNNSLVVIVDHDMPEMSGLEFCQKLGDFPKKIMLTAAADHKLAVQAFNDGIIDKFIAKDDPDVFKKIDQAVSSLQRDYFAEISARIVNTITKTTPSFLGNSIFQHFLKKFMRQNHINEFYLIDATGSFLLINKNNERLWLVVQSELQINNYLHIIENDDNPQKAIINALSKKEKLLCLFSEEDFNQPIESWKTYLHPAQKIEKLDGVYYAFIKN